MNMKYAFTTIGTGLIALGLILIFPSLPFWSAFPVGLVLGMVLTVIWDKMVKKD